MPLKRYRVYVRRYVSGGEDFLVDAESVDAAEEQAIAQAEAHDWSCYGDEELECAETTELREDGKEVTRRVHI